MRSEFVEKFNHDEDAATYDRDVADEENPVRAGYSAVLAWVAEKANAQGGTELLELGVGTGNLAMRLSGFARLVCVDVSQRMLEVAKTKLAGVQGIDFVAADLLAYFDTDNGQFDVVVSTYAIHHLTESEKTWLFRAIKSILKPGGLVIFGDLMFTDMKAAKSYLAECRESGREDLADDIADEFFWYLDSALSQMQALGFSCETRQFSDLSWGIMARMQSKA